MIEYQKQQRLKRAHGILIVKQSRLLHHSNIRGRHLAAPTITSTQVSKAIIPIIRNNVTDLYILKLRNQAALDGVVEEVSVVCDKRTIAQLYKKATVQPLRHSI